MSNFDSDSGPDDNWEERGELAWNEFDWERYLREQDEAVTRYLGFYEAHKESFDRIDRVAEKMGWGTEQWTEDADSDRADRADESDDDDDDFSEQPEVYTLHKNPIFIATKAIHLSLTRSWEALAADGDKVPQPLALALLASLHRSHEHVAQAIHALDFGDYAMAVSLFKRGLGSLNSTLALLNADSATSQPYVAIWREQALPRLFDLREIWLRVIAECREELEQPSDDES